MMMKNDQVKSWGILIALVFIAFGRAAMPVSASEDARSAAESQRALSSFFDHLAIQGSASSSDLDEIERWLSKYRASAVPAQPDNGAPLISQSPYLDFVLAQEASRAYAQAYQAAYARQKPDFEQLPVGFLYDTLLQLVVSGQADRIPIPSLQRAAHQIGSCLATQALGAEGPSCKLDTDEKHIPHASLLNLAWAKLTCRMGIAKPCFVRRAVYSAAKGALIQAKKDTKIRVEIQQQLLSAFNTRFQERFFASLNQRRLGFADFVSKKIGSGASPLWATAPLVETFDPREGTVQFRGFAEGLKDDIDSARYLIHSDNPVQKATAATLLYAAGNRLLLLTGGKTAKWDSANASYDIAPAGSWTEKTPSLYLALKSFGGLGVRQYSGKETKGVSDSVDFEPWDWAGYNPAATPPSPMQLFPEEFRLDPTGAPHPEERSGVETLGSLAALGDAIVDFLEATSPGGPLSAYFGSINDLEDAGSPAIFPREARKVAVGVIGAMFKNLLAPGFGHVRRGDLLRPGDSLRLTYSEDAALAQGRGSQPASVDSLSRALSAIIRFRRLIPTDSDAKAAFISLLPEIDLAIDFTINNLVASGISTELGGFNEGMGVPGQSSRQLMTAVDGMTALTQYYELQGVPAIPIVLRKTWDYLGKFWVSGATLPRRGESGEEQEAAGAHEIWAILNLWDQSQQVFKTPQFGDFDRTGWQARIQALKQQVQGRFLQ